MSTTDKQAIIDYCDALVKTGDVFTIHWDGGNDSGQYELRLNGEDIACPWPEEAEQLMQLVHHELGYCSFAGDFSCYGSAQYDSDSKCFTGIDEYNTSEISAVVGEFPIEIPSAIWFDQLEIVFTTQEYVVVDITPVFANGPIDPSHIKMTEGIEKKLYDQVTREIKNIADFSYMEDRLLIERGDFEAKGDKLLYTITHIDCQIDVHNSTNVLIDLNE